MSDALALTLAQEPTMNLTYLEIDHNRSAYDAMPLAMRAKFMERLSQGWLYHEHALEGVVLTQQDIQRALEQRPCRNYCDGQVQKSLRALHGAIHGLMAGPRDRGQSVSLEWLKEQHAGLCSPGEEIAGRYRKRDTSPGVYNLDVAPAASISYYLRKFIDQYHQELRQAHPVRAAAIAHWEFMRVFPFDERTGLVGRLLMNYILISHDYPPAIIHANDRHLYFNALNGHATDLISVVVEAVGATTRAAEMFSREYFAPAGHRAAL